VCLVTDRRRLVRGTDSNAEAVKALQAVIGEAIEGGVDAVQIRELDLDASALRDLVGGTVDRARTTGTRVIVNDRADVACVTGASAVHLRADGPPAPRVRALLPAGVAVGRSIHSLDEVRSHADADYLVFGTVFATASKPDVSSTGVEALGRVVGRSRVPVMAIGGVDAARAEACGEAGATGVAAIGAFARAAGRPGRVAETVRELREALERGRARGGLDRGR